jgi:hypothetical protein
MDKDKIKRRRNGNRKKILINVRISDKLSKWLREKNYSPTGIFYEAVKDLGYQDGEDE